MLFPHCTMKGRCRSFTYRVGCAAGAVGGVLIIIIGGVVVVAVVVGVVVGGVAAVVLRAVGVGAPGSKAAETQAVRSGDG